MLRKSESDPINISQYCGSLHPPKNFRPQRADEGLDPHFQNFTSNYRSAYQPQGDEPLIRPTASVQWIRNCLLHWDRAHDRGEWNDFLPNWSSRFRHSAARIRGARDPRHVPAWSYLSIRSLKRAETCSHLAFRNLHPARKILINPDARVSRTCC